MPPTKTDKRWIGVDLDGTLAQYTDWRGSTWIGAPIPQMLRRVKQWLAKGWTVKILTARAKDTESREAVELWLRMHGIGGLEITDCKDYHMIALFDDRAVTVEPNTGRAQTLNPTLQNLLEED